MRQAVVVAMSFGVFFFSSFVMYSVWSFLDWELLLFRAGISFLAWVVAFTVGSRIFWKTVEAIQSG
jgi:hypothetical protein